jgi:hypothetical protein
MEDTSPFLLFVLIVFGILQIILFFKIWGMTNDSKAIRKLLEKTEKRYYFAHHPEMPGWAEGVTDDEKVEALDLVDGLGTNRVIVKLDDNKSMECWSLIYWESVKDNPCAKLIFHLPKIESSQNG